MSFFIGVGLVLILSIILAGTVLAADKTLLVTSSQQRIDYGNRVLFYKGEVKAVWKDIVLEADEMEVYLTEKNTLKEIIAKGNVKVLQKEKKRQISGAMATYDAKEDRLIMEGQAHYQDELGNDLQAEKIILWIGTEKLEAEGTPVKATYVLEELKKEKAGGSASGESSKKLPEGSGSK